MDFVGEIFFFFFKYRTSSFIDVFSASAGLKNESIKLSGQMCECKDGETPTADCKLVLMSSVFFLSLRSLTEREKIAMPKTTKFHSVIQLRLIRFAY